MSTLNDKQFKSIQIAGDGRFARNVSLSKSEDAFNRIRVSSPFGIFENKNLFNKNDNQFEERTNGVGASISYLSNESAVKLEVGTASGEYAIRQTSRYHAYVPGKSHFIVMTGVMGASKDGNTKRLGYFDDKNGLFFEYSDNIFYIVHRSNASGSVVDTKISQSDFNFDTLDGTGKLDKNPSELTLDLNKSQIFEISFQWLGVGQVIFSLNLDGKKTIIHKIFFANNSDTVYMATPSLPCRYETRNTALTTSISSMKEICMSVVSEGGYNLPGFEFAASNGITPRSLTTRVPVFAIRLLDSFGGKDNRRTIRILHGHSFAIGSNILFEIGHVHNPSAITATWSAVGGGSAAEYSTDITAVTGNPEHYIDHFYASSGQAGKGGEGIGHIDVISNHAYISQNFESNNSQMFVLYATSMGGAADAYAGFTWIEFD